MLSETFSGVIFRPVIDILPYEGKIIVMITFLRLFNQIEKYYHAKKKSDDNIVGKIAIFSSIVLFICIYFVVICAIMSYGNTQRRANPYNDEKDIFNLHSHPIYDHHSMESLLLEGLPPLKRKLVPIPSCGEDYNFSTEIMSKSISGFSPTDDAAKYLRSLI